MHGFALVSLLAVASMALDGGAAGVLGLVQEAAEDAGGALEEARPLEQPPPVDEYRLALEQELDEPWTLQRWWISGGSMMYVVALLGLVGLALAGVHFAVRSRVTVMLGGALAVLTLLAGIAGRVLNRRAVDLALAAVNPADRDLLLRLGYREADVTLQLGVAAAAAVGVLLLVGEVVRRSTGGAPAP